MRGRTGRGLAALALGLALGAAAPAPADLPSLFPMQAAVGAPAGTLVRLDLPAEVLAACRPDLSDIRLIVPDGREVAYAVLEGLAPDRSLEVRRTAAAELLGAERETRPGPGDDGRLAQRTERYVLAPPPAAEDAGTHAEASERWDLVLTTGRSELVRRVTLTEGVTEGSEAGDGGRLLWAGSIFRLPGEVGTRESLRIPLPALGAGLDLRVVLEGQDDRYLEPGFRYERVREIAGPARTRVPLPILSSERSGGTTSLEVERPRGLVPDRIEIESSTTAFDRRVEVWDRGSGGEGRLGWGALRRTGTGDGDRDEVGDLAIALRPPHGDRLRIEIRDGDSPPLDDLRVFAAVRRPALVFALPAPSGGSGTGGAATLYFGGGRALAPRYDLQGLVSVPVTGDRVAAAERLYDPALLPAAEIGNPRPNPRFEATPALAFAMHPGAELDRQRWAWRRPLDAKPSPEGLIRLRLAPDDLARARGDLGDLRIAGGANQWAYLLGDRPASEPHDLEIASVTTEKGATRYELAPPAAPVPIEGLTLRVAAPFFDRPFVLEGRLGDRMWTLAEGRLVLPPRDPRPVEIGLNGGASRVDRLILTIENGNDAPLDLTGASAWLPLPEIYFAAPAGEYDLLLGNPEAEAPRYELARVRDVVLTVPAGAATAGDLEPNPGHRPGLGALLSPRAQKVFLWVVLALAVALLALLTLRLARHE